jgi:DNA-binding MarR family transcriptional regulator
MESPFNPTHQNQKKEGKIVMALERISEAFRVLLWNECKENGLSPIQTRILLFLLFQSRDKCKVSYLAQEFNMSKATISDSLKPLLQKELIEKLDSPLDSRSFAIALTKKGKSVANKSASFAFAIEKPLRHLPDGQKEAILSGLLTLIYELNKSGIVTVQRMCLTCANYNNDGGMHFCKLLGSELPANELRIDCPEHLIKL